MVQQFHLELVLVALATGFASAMVWLLLTEPLRSRVVGVGVLLGVVIAGVSGAPRPLIGGVVAVVGIGLAADRGREVAGPSMRLVGLVSLVGVWLAVQDTEAALAIGGVLVPVLAIESGAAQPFIRGERWVLLGAVIAAVAGGATGVPAWAGGLACAGLLVSAAPVGTIGVAVHVVAVAAASRLVTRLEPVPAVVAGVGILVAAAVYESLLSAAVPARRER